MSSPPSPVTSLGTHQELRQKLEGARKLVVLEFVKPGSQIWEYVKTERDKIAEQMKDEAEFYELDVDAFKIYAEKLKVEALPAFVVMQNFVKKRHVVGTDDLKKAIDDAYTKFQTNMQNDCSPNNGSEQGQAEANNASNVESARNNSSQPEQPGGPRGPGAREPRRTPRSWINPHTWRQWGAGRGHGPLYPPTRFSTN